MEPGSPSSDTEETLKNKSQVAQNIKSEAEEANPKRRFTKSQLSDRKRVPGSGVWTSPHATPGGCSWQEQTRSLREVKGPDGKPVPDVIDGKKGKSEGGKGASNSKKGKGRGGAKGNKSKGKGKGKAK